MIAINANPADYANLIRKTARHYRDIEDAEQEAWLCFCEAVSEFDQSRGVYFATYLQQKLRWHFKKLIRTKQQRRRAIDAQCEKIRLGQCSATDDSTDTPAQNPEQTATPLPQLPARTLAAVRLLQTGSSIAEAATAMRCSQQTIRSLLRYAAQKTHRP